MNQENGCLSVHLRHICLSCRVYYNWKILIRLGRRRDLGGTNAIPTRLRNIYLEDLIGTLKDTQYTESDAVLCRERVEGRVCA
ncbi:MAG: hypothetical protein CFK48_04170 [Armatimonadetes bacterium CP1_7O]|nr:MAG: hypothetical protein CFK48_04170 [Armatimonadetes bacterium CP1_7O]